MALNNLLGATVLWGVTASGVARADDFTGLKAEIGALEKQQEVLEKRLALLERRRAATRKRAVLQGVGTARGQKPVAQSTAAARRPVDSLANDLPAAWNGITVFGVLDAGVAWQSHGTPLNGRYPQGLEYAISKNSNRAGFQLAPGGMGYSGIGLKGAEPLLPGLAGVFAFNTQFDPLSGRVGDGPASLVQNNGVPLNRQSSNSNSARSGQAFNDFAYLGLSSATYGSLTFGRQRTLITDDYAVYDPIANSLAFSMIGYTGSLSSGHTENTRFDQALKYRVDVGPARFAAIYKLAAPGAGASRTGGGAYQVSAGFDVQALSFDAIYSRISDAINLTSLSAAQTLTAPPNTLAATISDNTAIVFAAKYTFENVKFFGGYEQITYADPKYPISAPYVDENGYALSVANDTAYAYHNRTLQLFWTGLKYAYSDRLDLSFGYYHELQNSYGKLGCNYAAPTLVVPNTSACSGTEDALSLVAEYHFNRRMEIYGGMMYSKVAGGIASGFLYTSTIDPAVGLRYEF